MDVNAIDLTGADGTAAELERLAADNVKRVVRQQRRAEPLGDRRLSRAEDGLAPDRGLKHLTSGRLASDEDAMADRSLEVRLSEVIGALSFALDLADGHALGHSVRTCAIGMRLAVQIGLDEESSSALYYSLLLKDAGCSANASQFAHLYRADDRAVKHKARAVDYTRPAEALRYIWGAVGGQGLGRVANAVRASTVGVRQVRELTVVRCDRGAEIARMIDLPEEAAAAIRALDEHWDGAGHPYGLAGEEIPLLGRILALAQAVEVFCSLGGRESAYAMAAERSGRWYDPDLVAALEGFRRDEAFWDTVGASNVRERLADLEPPDRVLRADGTRLDQVAEAFALVVDAKSPFTVRHSERVAVIAVAIATHLGLDGDGRRELRRAGLLHDVGKLGVSNTILDKAGPLTEAERAEVNRHPAYTVEILSRIDAFRELADVAGAHHERLDGSGYHRGRTAESLDLPARILAVADVYEALTAERPYREALTPEEALAIVAADAGRALCAASVGALDHLLDALPLAA